MSTLRPLVIVGIGGGLVQWDITKPGTGNPIVHYLDYDIEGVEGEELLDFADRIEAAVEDLQEHGHNPKVIHNFHESIKEYRQMAANGESAGRYR